MNDLNRIWLANHSKNMHSQNLDYNWHNITIVTWPKILNIFGNISKGDISQNTRKVTNWIENLENNKKDQSKSGLVLYLYVKPGG